MQITLLLSYHAHWALKLDLYAKQTPFSLLVVQTCKRYTIWYQGVGSLANMLPSPEKQKASHPMPNMKLLLSYPWGTLEGWDIPLPSFRGNKSPILGELQAYNRFTAKGSANWCSSACYKNLKETASASRTSLWPVGSLIWKEIHLFSCLISTYRCNRHRAAWHLFPPDSLLTHHNSHLSKLKKDFFPHKLEETLIHH